MLNSIHTQHVYGKLDSVDNLSNYPGQRHLVKRRCWGGWFLRICGRVFAFVRGIAIVGSELNKGPGRRKVGRRGSSFVVEALVLLERWPDLIG